MMFMQRWSAFLSLLAALPAFGGPVVINEIMYHPAPATPEPANLEWIELRNTGAASVDLHGWKFTKGVSFTITNVTLPPDGYLVVTANRADFLSTHPGATNVFGNWLGVLSNNGEELELRNATGGVEDSVAYASEGDWAVRVRGPLDLSHYGWKWEAEADGLGASLELINPGVLHDSGQNWGASTNAGGGGTPGAANSIARANSAPLILEVVHFPLVPKSTDTVTVTARVLDELNAGVTATLFYRNDANPQNNPFQSAAMFDDGAHGDGLAGDGVYGAFLPTRPNNAIVEFYVRASDAAANARTWPAAARQLDGSFAQTANLLYQVDDQLSPYGGSQSYYRLIMTAVEAAELDTIGRNVSGAANSDAEMNGTFISTDGAGQEVRYTASFRNRGHGSRTARPNNIRVSVPNDRPWNGVRSFNLNSRYTHSQVAGSAIFQKAGLPMANSKPVQVRVNNQQLATDSSPMFGAYAHNEEISSEFAAAHFPTDDAGNAYRGVRIDSPSTHADLSYRGPNTSDYDIL